ncbi:hypothetical protein ABZS66_36310 [Dactylosporangium sp. NPDC005572]|uniref:hypothetical protein n=1 Tax=Dactylosporangium sp. NPDC005572 TaxID=3156889 RepID=UPI0033AE26FF
MAINIARGVVSLIGDVDRAQIRRNARVAATIAADESEKEARRRKGGFFSTLFDVDKSRIAKVSTEVGKAFLTGWLKSNAGLAQEIYRGFASFLSKPLVALFGVIGLEAVAGFVAAILGSAALASLIAGFGAIGVFMALSMSKSFEDAFNEAMKLDRAQLKLAESAAKLSEALKEGKRTLDLNTEAGRNHINAILDQVQAYKDVYDANIAAGMSVAEATKRYNESIDWLKKHSKELGYNAAAVDELLNKYRKVPSLIDTVKDAFNQMKRAVGDASLVLVQPILDSLDVAKAIFKEKLINPLRSVFNSVGKYFTTLTVSIGEGLYRFITQIDKALKSGGIGEFINQLTANLPRIFEAVGEASAYLAGKGNIIGNAFGIATTWIEKFFWVLSRGIVVFSQVLVLLSALWNSITSGVGSIGNMATAWSGVTSSLGGVLTALSAYATALTDGTNEQATKDAATKLSAAWATFKTKLAALWDEIFAKIKEIWANNIKPWLTEQAKVIMDALLRLIGERLVSLGNDMLAKARQAVANFIVEIATLPIKTGLALASLPITIGQAIANAATRAYEGGQAIISSLINGLTSRLQALRNIAEEIGQTIADFLPGSPVKKGPLRVLNNHYAGGQIVKMLSDGMAYRMKLLDFNSNMMAGNFAGTFGSDLADGIDEQSSITKNFYITQNISTQEISPIRQAAALGWEVSTLM